MLFGDVIKLDFVNDFDRHLFLCQNMSLQGMQINTAQLNLTLKSNEVNKFRKWNLFSIRKIFV